jgi:hypothetical protein
MTQWIHEALGPGGLIVGAAGALFAWLRTRRRDRVEVDTLALGGTSTAIASMQASVEAPNRSRDDAWNEVARLRAEIQTLRTEIANLTASVQALPHGPNPV